MDKGTLIVGIVGALSLCACSPGDEESLYDDIEFRSGVRGNSPARPGRPGGSGWISNGLSDHGVGGVSPWHPLTSNLGMSEEYGLLVTEEGREIAEYLIECALPWDRTITKTVGDEDHVMYGLLGLAAEWEDGVCDNECQKWVSACMLARTNVDEDQVDIWIQADHPAIGFGIPDGLVHEASFYGNLFWTGDFMYYCEGAESGYAAAMREGRTCSTGNCGFIDYGSCAQVAGRCTMGGPDGDVPVDCRSDQALYGPTWPTISTFLPE